MWTGEKLTTPRNCQKLLARMLYDSVDCKMEPRAVCDWETAGALLDNHEHLIHVAVGRLSMCGWFTFRRGFSVETTLVDSGGFHETCWRAFWECFHRWAAELPKDKYGAGRGFC